MKIYVLKDLHDAQNCRQLIMLKSSCIKLVWSKTITDIPSDVYDSLECIEEFVDDRISTICANCVKTFEFGDEEETEMLSSFKHDTTLKNTIGTGVVLEGEVDSILSSISNFNVPTIAKALQTHENYVII